MEVFSLNAIIPPCPNSPPTAFISSAIKEMQEAGYLGSSIMGSGFSFDFRVISGRGSYVCGEETSLLRSIEGKRPEVGLRPPYPTEKGLFGKPTVVNNVETLAMLSSTMGVPVLASMCGADPPSEEEGAS